MLVLFGCGSVAVTVLFGAHSGLMQVALAWGIGVTLAIYLTRHLQSAEASGEFTVTETVGASAMFYASLYAEEQKAR